MDGPCTRFMATFDIDRSRKLLSRTNVFLPFLELGSNPRKGLELARPQTEPDSLHWLLNYELKLHNGNLGKVG